MKSLERELILDWQQLQRMMIPETKTAALKAYYAKLALYRRHQVWNLELQPLARPVTAATS